MSYFKDLKDKILGNELTNKDAINLTGKTVDMVKEGNYSIEKLIDKLCSDNLNPTTFQLVSKKLMSSDANVDDLCRLFTNNKISDDIKLSIYTKNAFYIKKIIEKGTFLQISGLFNKNVPMAIKKIAHEHFLVKLKDFKIEGFKGSNNPLYYVDSVFKILTNNNIKDGLKREVLSNTEDRIIRELNRYQNIDDYYLALFDYSNDISNILLNDVKNKIASEKIKVSDLIALFRYKGISNKIKDSLLKEYSKIISNIFYNCNIDDYGIFFENLDSLYSPVAKRILDQLDYKLDANILSFNDLCYVALYLCKNKEINPSLKNYFFTKSLRNIQMSVEKTGVIDLNLIANLFNNLNDEWSKSFIKNIDVIVLRTIESGNLNIDYFVRNNLENDFNIKILNEKTINMIKDLFKNNIMGWENTDLIKKLWKDNYNQANEMLITELTKRIKENNKLFDLVFKNYEWFKGVNKLNIYIKILTDNSDSLSEYLKHLEFYRFIELIPKIKGNRNLVLNNLLNKVRKQIKENESAINILLYLLQNTNLKDDEILFIYDKIKPNIIKELSNHINDTNYVISLFNVIIDLSTKIKKKKITFIQKITEDFLEIDFNEDILNYIKDRTIELGKKGYIPYAPEFVNSIIRKQNKINEQNKSLR